MAIDNSTRGIAAEWWEDLREFRTTHPPKRVTVDGVGWEYIASGGGEEDLLAPEQRAELRRCYPRARVNTFRGAGHTPWMSHREEYLSIIKEFLDQEEGTRT